MISVICSKTSFWEADSDCSILVYRTVKELKSITKGTPLSPFIDHYVSLKKLSDTKPSPVSIAYQTESGLKEILVIGIKKDSDLMNDLRDLGGNAIKTCRSQDCSKIALGSSFTLNKDTIQWIATFLEGAELGNYRYSKNPDPQFEATITYYGNTTASDKKKFEAAIIKANAQNLARDLANTPSNLLTPKIFVEQAKKLFKNTDVTVSVYSESDAKKKKMGSFLAVGQGSENPSYILELSLNITKTSKPTLLVGKGVTFDTGGISLKGSARMSAMKGDMGGAAAVCSALYGLSQLGTKKSVIGIIPLVENMPSGKAYKPGDVITAMNGKTIEVLNTDAEGRLILADALCLAVTKNPKAIVDIATLTGACSVALGDAASALCSNSDSFKTKCLAVQKDTGERLWELPLYPDYLKYLDSSVADLANCAENRKAGTSTAAMFLKQFIGDKPWVHLDIASTMSHTNSNGFKVKGMSGSGTRTLIQIILAH